MNISFLKLKNIDVKIEKKFILRNINLDVNKGDLTCILGNSGSGKSTLLNTVAGFNSIDSGSLRMNEIDINRLPPNKRSVTVMFQEARLFPFLNVEDNIKFATKTHRSKNNVSLKDRMDWPFSLLKEVGLESLRSRMPGSLSGGQKQRVSLARAIASGTEVLLLDEPFSSLDYDLRQSMFKLVQSLQRHYGLTVLMVTHDALEALRFADRIVYLDQGEILQEGPPSDFIHQPINQMVAGVFRGGIFNDDKFISFQDIQSCSSEGYLELQLKIINKEETNEGTCYNILWNDYLHKLPVYLSGRENNNLVHLYVDPDKLRPLNTKSNDSIDSN